MIRLRTIGFLIGLFLFGWILSSADLKSVWQQIRGIPGWRLTILLSFYGVIFGLDTLGWQCALNRQRKIHFHRLFRTRLAGEAMNYVTPMVPIGGEPVKAYFLSRRYGIPLSEGVTSVVVAKTTFSFSMLLFVVTGLLVTWATQPLSSSLLKWVWVTLPVLTVLLALFLLLQFLQPFRKSALFLQGWGPFGLKKLAAKVRHWDKAVTTFYRQSPKAVFLSLGFHFLGWMAGVLEVYLILRFLQIPISLARAWSIESLWVLLKSGAFLIPGTLGASEGFSLLICVALGINAVSALGLALIRRARELLWMGWGLIEFARG